jgi:hypothetical protein
MLINDELILYHIFRLHVGQGVLSVPSAAVVHYHRVTLCVAVRNEYQNIRHLERNYLRRYMPITFGNVVPLLQLCSLLY